MTEPKTTRIVLLGKTGAGKSSLANTIFREKLFKVQPGFTSGTSVCETKTKSVNGRKITLIDTPGFFDTDRSEEELKQEIVRCITECSPGPHAFLIVLKLERFTEQEEAVIHKMTEYFSEHVFKYSTVVFTHGHELPEGEKIEDLVKKNKSLSGFIEKCGGRCHVIDNDRWNKFLWNYRSNKFQVEEILKSIDKTVEANNGNCYMNEMLQITEELIQQKNRVNNNFIQFGALYTPKKACVSSTMIRQKPVVRSAKRAAGTGDEGATGVTTEAGGVIGAGLKVVGVVVGALAAVGAGFGGYEGHQAAQTAETPQEAAKTAAKAVDSKGVKAIKGAYNFNGSMHDHVVQRSFSHRPAALLRNPAELGMRVLPITVGIVEEKFRGLSRAKYYLSTIWHG